MSWKPTLNGLPGVLFRHCAKLWLNSDRCHPVGVKVYMQMRDGRDDFSPYLGESYDSLGGESTCTALPLSNESKIVEELLQGGNFPPIFA
ncbi:hypothetical protein NPIL_583061 [Nephila pilipes]|uniref:Uncharacterized protein n=1 Tax=Nephila pilipes TaxID=299642 RepID=A0A8X6PD93_NEPPI|nr:hypothetical protein NPIL_583061 [Nephila pilipes]